MKVADVRLSWSPSISPNVAKQVVSVTIDGSEPMVTEVSREVESLMVEVKASSSVVFSVETTDTEGLASVSELYTFNIGDLVAPLPATNLFHEIVGIRDLAE